MMQFPGQSQSPLTVWQVLQKSHPCPGYSCEIVKSSATRRTSSPSHHHLAISRETKWLDKNEHVKSQMIFVN